MEQAEVIDAATGHQLGHAVNFVRVPMVGEIIAGPQGGWSHVTAVLHNWRNGQPVAAIYVTPPAAHPIAGSMVSEQWQG